MNNKGNSNNNSNSKNNNNNNILINNQTKSEELSSLANATGIGNFSFMTSTSDLNIEI